MGGAVSGALLVAPAGFRTLSQKAAGRISRAATALKGRLPWYRKGVNITASVADGVAIVGNVSVTAGGWVWDPSAPVDARIERLRERIDTVSSLVANVQQTLSDRIDNVQNGLMASLADLRADLNNLVHEVQERERWAAEVDAAGLPVILVGLILTGWPGDLLPTSFAWVLVAVGVFAIAFALRRFIGHMRHPLT